MGTIEAIIDCHGRDQTIIVMCKSALETRAPLMQQGEPWPSALEPQGSLANEHDIGIVRTLWVLQ
jgi:hypothetical protein